VAHCPRNELHFALQARDEFAIGALKDALAQFGR
jgi:hypothetical protein